MSWVERFIFVCLLSFLFGVAFQGQAYLMRLQERIEILDLKVKTFYRIIGVKREHSK